MNRAPTDPNPTADWRFAFGGAALTRLRYDEKNFMTLDGSLSGASLILTKRSLSFPTESRARLSYYGGTLRYSGSLQGEGTLKDDPTRDQIADGELRWALWREDFTGLVFAAGLRGQWWRNKITGPGGYRRVLTHLSVPMGIEGRYVLDDERSWELRAGVFGRWLAWGQTTAFLGDNNPTDPALDFRQNAGRGVGLEMELTWAAWSRSGLSLGVGFERWDVKESSVAGIVTTDGVQSVTSFYVEPANVTDASAVFVHYWIDL